MLHICGVLLRHSDDFCIAAGWCLYNCNTFSCRKIKSDRVKNWFLSLLADFVSIRSSRQPGSQAVATLALETEKNGLRRVLRHWSCVVPSPYITGMGVEVGTWRNYPAISPANYARRLTWRSLCAEVSNRTGLEWMPTMTTTHLSNVCILGWESPRGQERRFF